MIVGFMSFPPFASAPYAAMTCRGVAEMPCPYAAVARRALLHLRHGSTSPGSSSSSSIPVTRPKPNRSIMRWNSFFPSFPDTLVMQVLMENSRQFVIVTFP